MTDLVIGKGKLYFERFVPGTHTRSGEGFAYFGNTPELTISKTYEKLEHFSSEGGIKEKDASLETSETSAGKFSTDHISPENVALWYRGTKSPIAQLAGVDVEDTWESIKRGNYFQLGETVGQPQGARSISGLTATRGNAHAAGTLTIANAVPVDGDHFIVNGYAYTFRNAPDDANEVQIGATITLTAAALRDTINANDDSPVTALAAVGVTTLAAKVAGTVGNDITLAKAFATGANGSVSAATMAGGTDGGALDIPTNFTVNEATGMVRALPHAADLADGDSVTFTYDQGAAGLTQIISGGHVCEGRLLFVADNPKGENKDHLWPYVQLTSDGDYALIGDDWQKIGFTYEVLKLEGFEREIITNRG